MNDFTSPAYFYFYNLWVNNRILSHLRGASILPYFELIMHFTSVNMSGQISDHWCVSEFRSLILPPWFAPLTEPWASRHVNYCCSDNDIAQVYASWDVLVFIDLIAICNLGKRLISTWLELAGQQHFLPQWAPFCYSREKHCQITAASSSTGHWYCGRLAYCCKRSLWPAWGVVQLDFVSYRSDCAATDLYCLDLHHRSSFVLSGSPTFASSSAHRLLDKSVAAGLERRTKWWILLHSPRRFG